MKVISIFNIKGGCGKTLTAQALIEGLREKGYRTLGIDLDHQKNLTDSVLKNKEPSFTINDLILETKPLSKIRETDFIASSLKLSMLDLTKINGDLFNNLFMELSPYYDYAILDLSPSINGLTLSAIKGSNGVIIPTECDIYSIKGVKALLENIIGDIPNLKVLGILITRYPSRTNISKTLGDYLDKIIKEYNTQVYKTRIRECITIKEIRTLQQDILTYQGGKNNASLDYRHFIREFLGDTKPKTKEPKTIIDTHSIEDLENQLSKPSKAVKVKPGKKPTKVVKPIKPNKTKTPKKVVKKKK